MSITRDLSPFERQQLRQKRLRLGLSYSALSHFLGVSVSALRKWEYGLTRRCRSAFHTRLTAFIRGEYDRSFQQQRGDLRLGSYITAVPPQLQQAITHYAACYRFMQQRPELCARFLAEADAAAENAVRQFYRQFPETGDTTDARFPPAPAK